MLFGIHAFALALILVMRLAPRSAAGRLLHGALVERPLDRLSRVRRHHLIFIAIMGFMIMFAGESLVMMGGLDLAAVYLLDVSIYIDLLAVTMAMSALGALKIARQALVRPVTRLRWARRARRFRTRRATERLASNDDDPAPARFAA
ncbi:MAG: hypothetical protein ABIT09_11115 [Croceibacterium sp.]